MEQQKLAGCWHRSKLHDGPAAQRALLGVPLGGSCMFRGICHLAALFVRDDLPASGLEALSKVMASASHQQAGGVAQKLSRCPEQPQNKDNDKQGQHTGQLVSRTLQRKGHVAGGFLLGRTVYNKGPEARWDAAATINVSVGTT